MLYAGALLAGAWLAAVGGCSRAQGAAPRDMEGAPAGAEAHATGQAVRREVAPTRPARSHARDGVRPAASPANRNPPWQGALPGPVPRWDEPSFLGRSEALILDRLTHGEIVRVKRSYGGRSVAFVVVLEDGTRGYFKPEQTVMSAQWHAEVVSYYLDRALGLGRVPPVVSRRFPWRVLEATAPDDPRMSEVTVDEDGLVRGALVWWLPERPTPLDTPPGWESWLRVEPWQPWLVSPLQRPRQYVASLRRKRQTRGQQPVPRMPPPGWSAPPDDAERPAALSDMILFDYLTQNNDRWGGDNANVLTLGEGGPLIFLDNGAGFTPGPHRRRLMERRLQIVQRFRKRTVQAIRDLDMRALVEALARDPHGPLLSAREIRGLQVRRRALLEHVDAQRARFGDAALPW